MAFLGSIGKFVGNVGKTLVKAAPSATLGYLAGGPAGALTGGLTSLTAGKTPVPAQFGGYQTSLSSQTSYGGAYGIPQDYGSPSPIGAGGSPMPVSSGSVMLTESVFNLIVKLAQQMGHQFKSAGGVHRWGRLMVAKLLRFARANPGLTVLNLLVNLGLSAFEANELLTWWATSGKKHRRIKVTNVKALNRSVRRLEGFRRLSHRVEAALSRRSGGVRTISRTRRCTRCKKSPCCC